MSLIFYKKEEKKEKEMSENKQNTSPQITAFICLRTSCREDDHLSLR